MSARLEFSPYIIVVWCTSCPDWTDSASNKGPAHDLAVEHERVHHRGCRRAYMNRAKYKERLQK